MSCFFFFYLFRSTYHIDSVLSHANRFVLKTTFHEFVRMCIIQLHFELKIVMETIVVWNAQEMYESLTALITVHRVQLNISIRVNMSVLRCNETDQAPPLELIRALRADFHSKWDGLTSLSLNIVCRWSGFGKCEIYWLKCCCQLQCRLRETLRTTTTKMSASMDDVIEFNLLTWISYDSSLRSFGVNLMKNPHSKWCLNSFLCPHRSN